MDDITGLWLALIHRCVASYTLILGCRSLAVTAVKWELLSDLDVGNNIWLSLPAALARLFASSCLLSLLVFVKTSHVWLIAELDGSCHVRCILVANFQSLLRRVLNREIVFVYNWVAIHITSSATRIEACFSLEDLVIFFLCRYKLMDRWQVILLLQNVTSEDLGEISSAVGRPIIVDRRVAEHWTSSLLNKRIKLFLMLAQVKSQSSLLLFARL